MANARNILVGQLGRYKLCRRCLDRNGSRLKASEPCYICKGLMSKIDAIVKKIASASREYQFDTFLIGAMLPMQIHEREDVMRARLKIRGRESVKSQLTRELGTALSKATGKKVDYLLPDLVITLFVDKDQNIDISTKSRPLLFQGRYTKQAPGMPQKQERCRSCLGIGCHVCEYSGLSGSDSIEGIIARELIDATKGQTPKFSWLGSEDRLSLVLGKGRPFYGKIFDPRKRKLGIIRVSSDSIAARISAAKETPVSPSRFAVTTRILVRCERMLTKEDLKKIRNLAGTEIKFDNRSKIATKRIYSANTKRIDDHSARITIVADGGLMIKQFVGGEEYMSPNVSEILGSKCNCVKFDILDVKVQSA